MAGRWRELLLFPLLCGLAGQERSASQPSLTPFEKDGKWGYAGSRGEVVIPPRFLIAQDFSSEGIAAIVDQAGWAYIDRTGAVIIRPFVFDNGPDYFREGLARFTEGGKFGFFDRTGKIVIRPTFTFARPFSGGLAAVCEGCKEEAAGEHRLVRGGKWGFIDRKGVLVVPPKFDEAEDFRGGSARVKAGGKWQRIDRKGKAPGS